MRSFFKNILIGTVTLISLLGFTLTAFAAGNINATNKYSQFVDTDLNKDSTLDLINWSPTKGGATVSNTAISGYIWGETVGWINLSPATSGVTNTCNGELGGYAWGENTGWINFEATNTTIAPNIDTSTGEITGQVWAQNYGWIELASAEVGFTGLITDWRPDCDNPDDNDDDIGSAATLKVIKNVVGGTAVPGDFIISAKKNGVNIVTPFIGSSSGTTFSVNTATQATIAVSELMDPQYTPVFSGDCPSGIVTFTQGFAGQKVCTITNTFGIEQLYACKDPAALNYSSDPNALAKNSLCNYKDPGLSGYACKDSTALNYNPDPALLEKNSLCNYPEVRYACKDPDATNYNSDPGFIEKNTLCNYPNKSYVCKDPTAINYSNDTEAVADNGLCRYVDGGDKIKKIITTVVLPILPIAVAVVGLLGSVPGIVARAGHILMTIAWGRKKIRGVVYDSNTKEPLDPVYVSVIDLATNQEVANQFTDMEGRFGFVLKKGHYTITAGKTNYQFPSVKLAGRYSDEVYDHLYFGESFTVENEDQVVSMNIPMDALAVDWNQVEKRRTSFLKYLVKGQTKFAWLFNAIFIVGFLASIMITYFYPIWWNYLMTALYVVIGILQVYGYGAIYAGKVTKDGNPLAGAVVRVWNPVLNHEIAHKVTSDMGAYYILVKKDDYYVTIDQRNPDGTFTKVFTSDVFRAKHGVIDKNFSL